MDNCSRTDRKSQTGGETKEIANEDIKRSDLLSSDTNACQALLKPDCTKHKVVKASGMPRALCQLLCSSLGKSDDKGTQEVLMRFEKLIFLHQKEVPEYISPAVKLITMEFAGVKFKTAPGISATNYIHHIERSYISKLLFQFPHVKRVVICEEKYSYTPDDFKAATRDQRSTKQLEGISHLKTAEEMLSGNRLDTDGIRNTTVGKTGISTYLAEYVKQLMIKKELVLDIDSEFRNGGCVCTNVRGLTGSCQCDTYAIPLRCVYTPSGLQGVSKLDSIHQKKGEAEMSQVDWILTTAGELEPGDSVVSIVTSGDIDAIVIHMFALAIKWPRKEDNTFCFPVYVILQKPDHVIDIYDVTRILQVLESTHGGDITFGVKVAIGLCMGGNDFIPKFQYISHQKVLQLLVNTPMFMSRLFIMKNPTITIDPEI
jgi:hypothetical protein